MDQIPEEEIKWVCPQCGTEYDLNDEDFEVYNAQGFCNLCRIKNTTNDTSEKKSKKPGRPVNDNNITAAAQGIIPESVLERYPWARELQKYIVTLQNQSKSSIIEKSGELIDIVELKSQYGQFIARDYRSLKILKQIVELIEAK